MGAADLVVAERVRLVLAFIAAAAAEGRETPSGPEMEAVLRAAGFTPYQLPKDIERLVRSRRLLVHGGKVRRVFEIPGTGHRTVARPTVAPWARQAISDRVRQSCSDWPRPTRESIAAYDASLRQGPPIRVQGPKVSAESWTHLVVRSTAPAQSLTGCSAALAAGVV
ncbi:hypothetical protein [Inquilinus sp. CA228]|uniref:hypothetical protein n=1 Tax=Inquilinus sp. CA228 TaxID=3455609 RepID=UPI003F8D8DCC